MHGSTGTARIYTKAGGWCARLSRGGALCRDGSVFTAITVADLAAPEKLYSSLGCKMAVGMPFKDIASSDTLLLREVPAAGDAEKRRALRRLQEVGMHVIVPLEALAAHPLADAIALVPLRSALQGPPALPDGCKRCAIARDFSSTS